MITLGTVILNNPIAGEERSLNHHGHTYRMLDMSVATYGQNFFVSKIVIRVNLDAQDFTNLTAFILASNGSSFTYIDRNGITINNVYLNINTVSIIEKSPCNFLATLELIT